MTDLISQLDIPRYPVSQKDNPFLENPLSKKDPKNELPQLKDPPKHSMTEKDPPLTEEDTLNPSNNPMLAYYDFIYEKNN